MPENFDLGWYAIEEEMKLYVNAGDLETVFVDFIHVDEQADSHRYLARHYDRAGELITELSQKEDNLERVLQDRETTSRPSHI